MLIFLDWYAYLYLGYTPTLIHEKEIRDELESNMIYDQSYPRSASLVISCLRFLISELHVFLFGENWKSAVTICC
jgi:hypothetical protein